MQTLILSREDINNPLHPTLWQQICEQFGAPLDSDMLELKVKSVKSDAHMDEEAYA